MLLAVRGGGGRCAQSCAGLSFAWMLLSDGMGGEAHGEVASAMAVETIADYCSAVKEDGGVTLHEETVANWSDKTRRLKNAVIEANFKTYQSAQKNPEQRCIGAPLTAAWL